jgi:non-specific serine/threonine protein kinase
VTVTGVGGVGKTTLAFEVARQATARLPDGAWTIDLAALPTSADEGAIVLAFLRSLGLVEQARAPSDVLIEHLEPRQALLVLDNCEHVSAVVGELVDRLLDACPYLRVLATSRAPLRVRGESVFHLQPLAIPDDRLAISRDALAGVASVELFTLRARAAEPRFQLDDDNASAIAAICGRLDGLPLGIELAAARVGGLGPDEILARLDHSDGLLRSESVATTEREETIEGALDWSYQLLTPAQQALFRRLAVFAGGWTLDAAEAVCGWDGQSAGIAADLAGLVDQSLIVRDPDGAEGRYRYLRPVAEFAAARLGEAGEEAALGMPHARYYLALSGHREAGATQLSAEQLDVIGADYENCLAAIGFAEAVGSAELTLGFAMAIAGFWRIRGHLQDGATHLVSAIELASGEPSFGLELAYLVLADYERLMGRYEDAARHALDAFGVAETIDEPAGQRTALAILGDIAAARRDYDTARARYEEAWPLVEALPHPIATGYWHANMGDIDLRDGRLEPAAAHLRSALDALTDTEETWYTARVHVWLGAVERRQGRLDAARSHLTAGFKELLRYGSRVDAIGGVEELARLALDDRDPVLGAIFLGAASALRDAVALAPDEDEREALAVDVDRSRAALRPADFEAAWARGRQMTFEEVARFATESGDPAQRTVRDARRPPPGSQLTRREREVAELIGEGLTNPQIAERLFISTGTVRGHVEQILGKLGLTSRVQVATWIATEGEKPVT